MRPAMLGPRPTKASLARQSKIRDSILGASSSTLKSIQNEQNKSEGDLTKRGGAVAKNHLFKRGKSLNKKLAAIVSSSSLDNSTGDGETLKQVVRIHFTL